MRENILRSDLRGGWPSAPQPDDHAARIARFALAVVAAAAAIPIDPDRPELGPVRLRAGFHSGPVVASVVGNKNPRYWYKPGAPEGWWRR